MNDRIKELAKQAGMWRQHYDIGEESTERLEKFVELIVKECASLCNDSNYTFGIIFSKQIKEHFGI